MMGFTVSYSQPTACQPVCHLVCVNAFPRGGGRVEGAACCLSQPVKSLSFGVNTCEPPKGRSRSGRCPGSSVTAAGAGQAAAPPTLGWAWLKGGKRP